MFNMLLLVVTALASVPWQESRRNVIQDAQFIDLPPNVFAPSGRLPSVEQILPLSIKDDPACTLVIAFCTKEGMAVVATRAKSPYLFERGQNVTANVTTTDDSLVSNNPRRRKGHLLQQIPLTNRVFDPPFAYLAPSLLAISAGNPVDSQLLRLLLQNSAEAARASLTRQSARTAARTLADQMQQRTQQANKGRLLASTAVLMDETELWRVDPTGQFYQCQVVVAGRAADKIHQEILRELTKDMTIKNQRVTRQALLTAVRELSLKESLSLAVRTIHSVLPQESAGSIYLMGVTTTPSTSEKPSTLRKYTEEELLEFSTSDLVA